MIAISALRVEGISQVWLADVATGGGKLPDLVKWCKQLVDSGKKWGCIVNGSKTG